MCRMPSRATGPHDAWAPRRHCMPGPNYAWTTCCHTVFLLTLLLLPLFPSLHISSTAVTPLPGSLLRPFWPRSSEPG